MELEHPNCLDLGEPNPWLQQYSQAIALVELYQAAFAGRRGKFSGRKLEIR
jgi:hypothetical protein